MDNLQPGTAPKVTPADIEAEIASEHYFTGDDGVAGAAIQSFYNDSPEAMAEALSGAQSTTPEALCLLTFCVLVLRNGFTVTGESACASPENFNADVGRKVARAAAVSKCWSLLGYALRTKLAGPMLDAPNWQTSPAPVPVVVPEMVIFDVQVASDPVNDRMLLQVKARIGDEAKACAMPFETGFTKEETTANKQAAYVKAVEKLEEAFGISRQQDA